LKHKKEQDTHLLLVQVPVVPDEDLALVEVTRPERVSAVPLPEADVEGLFAVLEVLAAAADAGDVDFFCKFFSFSLRI